MVFNISNTRIKCNLKWCKFYDKLYNVKKEWEIHGNYRRNRVNNISKLSFDKKVEYYKKSSQIKVDNIEITNKIVKLSTCSYINSRTRPTDQRYYIVATLNEID